MARGHVETPEGVAELMVESLFDARPPTEESRILYPGLGTGPFPRVVDRYCREHNLPQPDGIGVEEDAELASTARERLEGVPVEVVCGDFLTLPADEIGEFTHTIGNPPYVSIGAMNEAEKTDYRKRFDTAYGRFDLYFLFFERSLQLLEEGGELAFVTPEKYEYVEAATDLRRMLASNHHIREIRHLPEDAFPNHLAYPAVTAIKKGGSGSTAFHSRQGEFSEVSLPQDGRRWSNCLRGGDANVPDSPVQLIDISVRVSCGVATGAEDVFVQERATVPDEVAGELTHPSASGSNVELDANREEIVGEEVLVCPYDERGRLKGREALSDYIDWIAAHREQLEERWCVREDGAEWYEWHETPPMEDILQPKILCQDITEEPEFWIDREGDIVPLHSTYYIVPEDPERIEEVAEYLNSPTVADWLEANCQRASNGFLRVQASVLKELPVPTDFADAYQTTLV